MIVAAAGPVIPTFPHASKCVQANHWLCTDWIRQNWNGVLEPRFVAHVELSAIAVGIGFALSLALALLAYRVRFVARPIAVVSDFLYTIPSLALFILLVPITGIGWTTTEIALVSYTLLILFRNILVGLQEVPDDVREAAAGMGLTRAQSLVRVEFPLALPAIVAGLRIAVVSTISIATVAGFVFDQGLGRPINDAVSANPVFRTEIVAAGGLAVALALVADLLLVIVLRVATPWARRRAA